MTGITFAVPLMGNPRSKSYHQKYYKELLASLGLPDIHFHQLRNTYTTILLKHDFNIKGISHMLGHSKRLYQQTSMGILLKSLKIAYMLLNHYGRSPSGKPGREIL